MKNKYSITSLYSGSKGNCMLIESEKAKILIDAGKSARALCSALCGLGKSIDEIDAIFITHEHSDHISALEVLLKKHKIPVHMVSISAEKLISGKLCDVAELILNYLTILIPSGALISTTSSPSTFFTSTSMLPQGVG